MRRAGAAEGRAGAGIILAHGRGGSAADILSLLDHAGLPEVAGFAPEAPGQSWWPTSFLAPMAAMQAPLEAGLAAMRKGVAAAEAEGIPRDRIWLGGFSQGACLALEAFARDGDGLAGVLAFSGGLVGTGDAGGAPDEVLYGAHAKRFDYAGRRDGAKVWISVHERDPHIPVKRAEDSAAVLRGMGADVRFEVYPGAGHAVMQMDISAMRGALNVAA
ncbi:alpha/beta hydrolase [Pseudooceanicola sp. LIPI14-2-Ac024]|uniref:alpha/beta hydrolase n=1 Tax=Pseudooceanicola sp. LIPI14-2-Ac024 TaxID=3344875 RepID=UPI0035CF3EBC